MFPEMLPEERDSEGAMEYRRPSDAEGIRFHPTGRQSITILRLRAYRNDVEAKLEYGLRCVVPISSRYPQEIYSPYSLAAGLDVKQDIKAALKQFLSIVFGPYPDVMRAYAASLACSCCEYDWELSSWTPETQALCFHMANESLKFGLFSFPAFLCVNYMTKKARRKDIRRITALYPLLVATYDAQTKGVGSQIGLRRQCAACSRRLKRRRGFKTCSGPCKELKKPVYCNRECQKSVRFLLVFLNPVTSTHIFLIGLAKPPSMVCRSTH